MNRFIKWLILCLPMALHAQMTVDVSGAEAWLARAKDAPQRPVCWEAASAATEGGQMAEAAWSSFGAPPPENPATPRPADLAAFLSALKGRDLPSLERDVASLFPSMAGPAVQIKVVANGHPWGDMYVRRFKVTQGRISEDENGKPAILLNACLVAGPNYGATPEEQADHALDVLRHEVFHLYFDAYRAGRSGGKKGPDLKPAEDLLLTTQNEGIAHFLADRKRLHAEGFPPHRGEKALKDLEEALAAIRGNRIGADQLQNANEGPYWEKYAAISGMLFAYGVEMDQGLEGLRDSIREGPASLVIRYGIACARHPALPKPGPGILAWAQMAGRVDL